MAFALLQDVHLPEAHAGWLLERALQIPLNEAAVQEMRERLRSAVLERAHQESWVPSAFPLPEVFSKPLPLLRPLRQAGTCPCCSAPACATLLNAIAAACLASGFVVSCVLWGTHEPGEESKRGMAVTIDLLVCLLVLALASFAAWRWHWPRPAVALCTLLGLSYFTTKAVAVAAGCWGGHEHGDSKNGTRSLWGRRRRGLSLGDTAQMLHQIIIESTETALGLRPADGLHGSDAAAPTLRAPPPASLDAGSPPSPPLPPPTSAVTAAQWFASTTGPLTNSHNHGCNGPDRDIWWWPFVLCGLIATAALMQVFSAFISRPTYRALRDSIEPLSRHTTRL